MKKLLLFLTLILQLTTISCKTTKNIDIGILEIHSKRPLAHKSNKYVSSNLLLGNDKFWSEGNIDSSGIINISFDKEIFLNSISIKNGAPDDLFEKNNRAKKIKLSWETDSKIESINIDLKDNNENQNIEIPEIITPKISIEILEVYPGSKWNDTCLTAIDFFYNNEKIAINNIDQLYNINMQCLNKYSDIVDWFFASNMINAKTHREYPYNHKGVKAISNKKGYFYYDKYEKLYFQVKLDENSNYIKSYPDVGGYYIEEMKLIHNSENYAILLRNYIDLKDGDGVCYVFKCNYGDKKADDITLKAFNFSIEDFIDDSFTKEEINLLNKVIRYHYTLSDNKIEAQYNLNYLYHFDKKDSDFEVSNRELLTKLEKNSSNTIYFKWNNEKEQFEINEKKNTTKRKYYM